MARLVLFLSLILVWLSIVKFQKTSAGADLLSVISKWFSDTHILLVVLFYDDDNNDNDDDDI